MKIKTVAIIGAGAIVLPRAGEWIVTKSENDLHVKTPEEAKGVDLLIISVKYEHCRVYCQ